MLSDVHGFDWWISHWRKYFACMKHEVLCNRTGRSIRLKTLNSSDLSKVRRIINSAFRVRFAMKAFFVKTLLFLLFSAFVTSSIVAKADCTRNSKVVR